MTLRISTGFCRGMTLQVAEGTTRPTAAKVRSAVWNSLQGSLSGAAVLDLFAGTGAVGIEAVSRGAQSVTFVEESGKVVKWLRENLVEVERRAAQMSSPPELRVLPMTAERALALCDAKSFDIVWLDPPYAYLKTGLARLLPGLRRVARPEAHLLIESSADDLPQIADGFASWEHSWRLVRQKTYGKIGVSFLLREDEGSGEV